VRQRSQHAIAVERMRGQAVSTQNLDDAADQCRERGRSLRGVLGGTRTSLRERPVVDPHRYPTRLLGRNRTAML
jgi:hypothetical protein